MDKNEKKKYTMLTEKEQIRKFIDRFDAFILDCDGVLWAGASVFPNTKETIEALQKLGKKVFFQTNNSTRSQEEYAYKFKKKIHLKVNPKDIYCSSFLTAQYLKTLKFAETKKKVYVVGTTGIKKELDKINVPSFGYSDHDNHILEEEKFIENFKVDKNIGAVIMGYLSTINAYKIAYASCCARYVPDCLFLSTNQDVTFPMRKKNGDRFIIPGAGSYIASIEEAVQKKSKIIGKPTTFGIEMILKNEGLKKEKVCFVGDRLNTDMLMANTAGVTSCLVLSGISNLKDVEETKFNNYVPQFIIEKFAKFDV